MAAALPYVTAPGNIERALNAIKSAATPETVSQDFVKTILGIPGGSGNQMTSFLKKIGFANADGSPSMLYKQFRNSATAGKAAAQALKTGYAPLYVRNEYMHQLSDEKLKGLVLEETGLEDDSTVIPLVLASIKAVKKFADWSQTEVPEKQQPSTQKQEGTDVIIAPIEQHVSRAKSERVGLNLSYTINLNLPAASDVAVSNAIFKSLKDNLLKASDE